MSISLINYDFIFFALAMFFSLAFVDCRLLRKQYGRNDAWEYLSWFSGVLAANFWLELINQFYFIGENLLHINSIAYYFAWVFLLLSTSGIQDSEGEFSLFKGWWLFFIVAGVTGIFRSSEAFAITRSCFIGIPAIVMIIRSYRLGSLFKTPHSCICQKLAITSTVAFSVCFIFVETRMMIALGQPIMAACALFSMVFAIALWGCSRARNIENASEKLLQSQQHFKIFLPVSLALILPIGFVVTSYLTSHALNNEFETRKGQAEAFELILERYFAEDRSMVKTMCQSGELIKALKNSTDKTIEDANRILDIFSASLPGSVAYFMDKNGVTIASSNRKSEASFVGRDFSFRPYFKDAMTGKNGSLLAQGTVSQAYGYYSSAPIFEPDGELLGVGVIKISLDQLQTHFPSQPPIVLLDAKGAMVVSNRHVSYWEKLLPIDLSDFSTLSIVEDSGGKDSLSIMFKLADQKMKKVLNEANLIVWIYKLADSEWSFTQIVTPDSIVYARLLGLTLTLLASLLFIGASAAWGITLGSSEIIERKSAVYKSLVDGSPNIIAKIDINGNFLALNDRGREEFGFAEAGRYDCQLADLWGKESCQKVRDAIQEAINGQKAFCEAFRKDKDGRLSFWEFFFNPVIEAGNESKEIIVIIHNSTVRRIASQELKEEKDLTANIVNTAQAIILFLDQEGTVLRVNQYFFDLTGYDKDQVIGKIWLENFVSPRDYERTRNFFITNFANMAAEAFLNQIVKADGSCLEIEWRSQTIKDDAGKAIGIIGVGQDITEHQLMESNLRESKSKFAMLNNCFSRFGNSTEENISMLTEVAWLISGADLAVSREVFEGRLRTLGISSIREELPDDLKSHCPYCSSFKKFGKAPVLVKDLKQEENFCHSLGQYASAIIASAQIGEEQVGILVCAFIDPVEEVSEENVNLLSVIARSMEVEIARMREGRDLVETIRELASRDKRMSMEMEIARTVHRSFLPSAPPDFPPYEIGFVFKPCFSVGGDYFDFFQFQNHNQLGIFFADISGHGVAGALLASMLKVILLAVGQKSNEPAKVLMGMNDRIEENFPSGYFVSAFFALLDTENDVVKVACAAPEPIILIRKSGEVERVGNGGQPMGLLPSEFVDDESFESVELKLSEGDKILLFTDGLTDVKISDNERIGLARLCDWCKEFSHLGSAELTRRLYERAREMAMQGGIDDDIMILAIAKK